MPEIARTGGEIYRQGYHDGLSRALLIVRQTEQAGQTRASVAQYGAAKRRVVRVLAAALKRNDTADQEAFR